MYFRKRTASLMCAYLDEGGVQHIGGPGRLRVLGVRPEAAAAAGGAAAGMRLGEELLGGAAKLHHLHAQRLPASPPVSPSPAPPRPWCTQMHSVKSGGGVCTTPPGSSRLSSQQIQSNTRSTGRTVRQSLPYAYCTLLVQHTEDFVITSIQETWCPAGKEAGCHCSHPGQTARYMACYL